MSDASEKKWLTPNGGLPTGNGWEKSDLVEYTRSDLPPSAEVIRGMIKPLVWGGDFAHSGGGTMYHIKRTPIGVVLERFEGSSQTNQWHDDEAEAQAAANEHHANTILAALGLTE